MKSHLAQTIAALEVERAAIDLAIKKLKALDSQSTRVSKPRLVAEGGA